MWKLLKYELDYAKFIIFGFYLFALPFFIWNAFNARAFRPSVQVMIFCVTVSCSILGSFESKNKSIRIKRLLPISFVCASVYRQCFTLLLTLFYSASIALTETIRAGHIGEDQTLFLVQVSTGLVIFLATATLLSDLRFTRVGRFYHKVHPIVFPILILGVGIIYLLSFNELAISRNFQEQFYTAETANRMVILAVILIVSSTIVYFTRNSFVE